jgi:MOSC domain-containing protein YiiM
MHLVSVNVGTPQPIRAKSGRTGIFKKPQNAPVRITPLGLEGDSIVDTENHGGYDQAVYIFGTPDYDWWSRELGFALEPGTFGENLTITDIVSADYHAGDRFQAGAALLEVTSPRVPCTTLAARMRDPRFVKRFARAERFGLYCRVITPGVVQAGDPVVFTPYAGDTVSVLEMFRRFYTQEYPEGWLRSALASPMHNGDRARFTALLEKLAAEKPRSAG